MKLPMILLWKGHLHPFQSRRQRWGQWFPTPPFEICAPDCCIHPMQYFWNVPPHSVFFAPLLLNPDDGAYLVHPLLEEQGCDAPFIPRSPGPCTQAILKSDKHANKAPATIGIDRRNTDALHGKDEWRLTKSIRHLK